MTTTRMIHSNFHILTLFLLVQLCGAWASIGRMKTARSSPMDDVAKNGNGRPQLQTSPQSLAGEGDRDTLALIYNSLQKESSTLLTISQTIIGTNSDIQQWQCNAIKTVFKVHSDNIQNHLETTETFLLPKLKQHVDNLPEADILESQQNLRNHLTSIQSTMSALRPGRANDDYHILSNKLNQYNQGLHDHFAYKTKNVLSPSKDAMTAWQWGRTLQKYMEKGGVEMGSFIHHMGVDTFRDEWMSFCKLPRFLWGVYFKKGWDKFQDEWQHHVSALEQGVAPAY